jgi:hypothetical protein
MNIHNFGNESEKPFHSHAYVDTTNGNSIGSTNIQSFGERYSVERNRKSVRSYRDSHIGRGSLSHHARRTAIDPFGRLDASASAPSIHESADGSAIRPVGGSRSNAVPPRASFKEPPTRGFNPYA